MTVAISRIRASDAARNTVAGAVDTAKTGAAPGHSGAARE
jgi:hypothetical protein